MELFISFIFVHDKNPLQINESLVPQHLLPRLGNLGKKLKGKMRIKISKMLKAEIFMMGNRRKGFKNCYRNVHLVELNDKFNEDTFLKKLNCWVLLVLLITVLKQHILKCKCYLKWLLLS